MQQRYNEYQAPVLSLDSANKLLGALWPGRFTGFDTMTYSGVGNNVSFTHTVSGLTKVNSGGTYTNPIGYILTQQGIVITEDGPIGPFVLDDNDTNTVGRIDYLICTHVYSTVTPGGTAAVYSILKGPMNNMIAPAIPNPATTTVLGIIEMPGADTISNLNTLGVLKYTPLRSPDLAGQPVARLGDDNIFSGYNIFQERVDFAQPKPFFIGTGSFANHLNLGTDTNWLHQPGQGGSLYTVYAIQHPGTFSGPELRLSLDSGDIDQLYIANWDLGMTIQPGFRPVLIPKRFINQDVALPTVPYQGLLIGAGSRVELVYDLNWSAWVVTNVVDVSGTDSPALYNKSFIYGTAKTAAISIPNTSSFFTYLSTMTTLSTNDPGAFTITGGTFRPNQAGLYKLEAFLKLSLAISGNDGIARFSIISNINSNLDLTGTYADHRRNLWGTEVLRCMAIVNMVASESLVLGFDLTDASGNNLGAGTAYGELIVTKL